MIIFICSWIILFFFEPAPEIGLREYSVDYGNNNFITADLLVNIEYILSHESYVKGRLFKYVVFFIIFLLYLRYFKKSRETHFYIFQFIHFQIHFFHKDIIFLPREQIP